MLCFQRMRLIIMLLCFIVNYTMTMFVLQEGELGILAKKYNCDKGYSHDYIAIYNKYFENIRHKPLKFLEIGFLVGDSAHMWEEYFPSAELHFLDNNRECINRASTLTSRSHLHIVDQSKEADLVNFVNQVGLFDIIIDDGGHTMVQQKTSFNVLFSYVKPGGLYIIEDLHTSYWKSFGGEGTPGHPKASVNSTTEFLKKLTDNLNYVGSYTGAANRKTALRRIVDGFDIHGVYNFPKDFFETLDYNTLHIKSIHFYDSLCFIFKW